MVCFTVNLAVKNLCFDCPVEKALNTAFQSVETASKLAAVIGLKH